MAETTAAPDGDGHEASAFWEAGSREDLAGSCRGCGGLPSLIAGLGRH
jgi:hypothetical protein